MDKILNEKYLGRMNELKDKFGDDKEILHVEADDILCELLVELGYIELVNAFCKVPKWYA